MTNEPRDLFSDKPWSASKGTKLRHPEAVRTDWKLIAARDLAVDDTIRIDYEPGDWVVDAIFFEGPTVVVLDLSRADGAVTEWHLGADHEILRSPGRV